MKNSTVTQVQTASAIIANINTNWQGDRETITVKGRQVQRWSKESKRVFALRDMIAAFSIAIVTHKNRSTREARLAWYANPPQGAMSKTSYKLALQACTSKVARMLHFIEQLDTFAAKNGPQAAMDRMAPIIEELGALTDLPLYATGPAVTTTKTCPKAWSKVSTQIQVTGGSGGWDDVFGS